MSVEFAGGKTAFAALRDYEKVSAVAAEGDGSPQLARHRESQDKWPDAARYVSVVRK